MTLCLSKKNNEKEMVGTLGKHGIGDLILYWKSGVVRETPSGDTFNLTSDE